MRHDIDPQSIVKLQLIGRLAWTHTNGALVEAADYTGYRARTPSGDTRVFLALHSGDLAADWLDITDHTGHFVAAEAPDAANRLARKLGLKHTPNLGHMAEFAKRVRALQQEGRTPDQAAIIAAKEKFPAEFEPTPYVGLGEPIETLLREIER